MSTRSFQSLSRAFQICALGSLLMVSGWCKAQTASAPAAASAKSTDDKTPHYLRVVEEKGKSISLQIATQNFTPTKGNGPTVGLVGVAHIGDESFYKCLQKELSNYEVVLYESVKPPGTGGAGGKTDQEQIDSTKAAMKFVGGMIETYHAKLQSYPEDVTALKDWAVKLDVRLAKFLNDAMHDAWGHQLHYQFKPGAAPDQPAKYSLVSLGADDKVGGQGVNADLDLADQPLPDPMQLSKEDGIQTQLANALNLKFQLDAVDYSEQNWRCSDMAMDEVNRRLQAKGLDFSLIGGTLAGSSLPAKMIKIILGLMKFADTFLEGAIADTFKVVMIEMLGDERMMQQGLDQQLGAGFSEVIVQDRNQVAIDDLKKMIEHEPDVKSVAIFYGAAHMPDMTAKLMAQLGYEPAKENQQTWLTAITVDYSKSAVSQSDINRIRLMMRQMMRQQMRGK